MRRKLASLLKDRAEWLLAVRQPETVVVELLVTATRNSVAVLRQWAHRQGVDVDLATHPEAGRDASSLYLRQVRVLDGRTAGSIRDQTVAAWLADLQDRPGITAVSLSHQPVPPAVWREVRTKKGREFLEVVLLPEGQGQEVLDGVAVRHGKEASQLRFANHWSWGLRPTRNRFLWILVPVFLLLMPLSIVEVVLPRSRSLVLLAVCFVLIVCGLFYLIKDQSVRAVSTQFALLGAALVGICYEASRYAYDRYYDLLGTTPERVGLDYRSIMSSQPFFVLSVLLVLLTVALSVYALVKTLWRWSGLSLMIKITVGAVLILYALLLTSYLPARALYTDANRAAETVRTGGSPSTGGTFAWPNPARVALATPPTSSSGVEQSAYPTTLADADLRLLGGDASSWFILDSVSGTTFPLPRATSPLLIAESGVDRVVTLTRTAIRPERAVIPALKPQKIAVYNETGMTCGVANGPYEVHEHGSTFIVMVTVQPRARVAVPLACQAADRSGVTALHTVQLVAGQE